ncbi:beta-ketoacyl-[acyl-carrier-protein] synthase family protein [Xenorhabdus japonica]|uniref:3-oxoacyl-[acyl-carrier-protein] synthase II n=1 Tax=Xenorhabdus japonica TaxID=53341 RepID=A0A1I4YDQ4_9GAMM|nr:beta-ketoacyl-[acyl-carrier-protein] synthase family protein [Xenorhabdus japonica]SFN35730.1 3-oxoacyl-[acyl-carrier-protein] synthase II [Xenorhabdus japonica]
MNKRRVVVTGYGAISPLGENSHDIWHEIIDKSIGYEYIDLTKYNIKSKYFGLVKNIPSIAKREIDRCLGREGKLSVHAASEAIQHAFPEGNLSTYYSSDKMGVILGVGWGGSDAYVDLAEKHQKNRYAYPFSNLLTMASTPAGACAILFNLQGYQNTVVAACASGSLSIGQAYREIQRGTVDMMLAGGMESMRTPAAIWSIDVLQALSKEQHDITKASCPFSADRNGFVLSEGAAMLVLEEYESARRRDAPILGEILGYGYRCDAVGFVNLSDDISIRADTITQVIQEARISSAEIQYINAHGTSTLENDLHETLSLKHALGKMAYNIPISSTKSYTGHLIGAAGALESIICLKAIETGIMPATLNLQNVCSECDLDYLPNEHRFGLVERCLNLSAGFGGHNTALLFGKYS